MNSNNRRPLRVALYARVSTDQQTTDNQLLELREVADRNGWTTTEYVDHAVSGAKASRPSLNRMLQDARRGRLDIVCVWRADRLGRSLLNALLAIADLDARGVQIVSLREGFDSRTPSGKLQMHLVLAFAEYERESIRERIFAGLRRAKLEGKRPGPKPKIHPLSAGAELVADFSLSGSQVAARLRCSKETVNRLRRRLPFARELRASTRSSPTSEAANSTITPG